MGTVICQISQVSWIIPQFGSFKSKFLGFNPQLDKVLENPHFTLFSQWIVPGKPWAPFPEGLTPPLRPSPSNPGGILQPPLPAPPKITYNPSSSLGLRAQELWSKNTAVLWSLFSPFLCFIPLLLVLGFLTCSRLVHARRNRMGSAELSRGAPVSPFWISSGPRGEVLIPERAPKNS